MRVGKPKIFSNLLGKELIKSLLIMKDSITLRCNYASKIKFGTLQKNQKYIGK